MNLYNYFFNNVYSCRSCGLNKELSPSMTFNKLLPFNGKGISKVLLLGHSPKVRTTTSISETLDLNQENNLRRYITNEILHPLNIQIEDCSATNLVKCITTKMPEDLFVDGNPFMDLVFQYCKTHFVEEVIICKPKLIISFSERVSNLLQQEYGLTGNCKSMKQIFGTLQQLKIDNIIYPWIPVVHIPKPKVRTSYFPEQTKRLINLKEIIDEILN